MEGDRFASPDAHPQLEPIEPIQSAHAFAVDEPAFAAEPHPNALIPKPGPGVRQISNPDPQGRLILRRLRRYQEARPNCANRQARRQLT